MSTGFRALPSVDHLLGRPQVHSLTQSYSRQAVTDLVRQELEGARAAIANGTPPPSAEELAQVVARRAAELWRVGPRTVINATGVIIHTNLGRAPLSSEALHAIQEAARGYSNLEYTLEEGGRGSRQQHVEHLLSQLTGAEAALVVNNNASAVLLALTALAHGGEVIVSRGEGVEIGGGFRIPDVMRQSSATLVEVGTTNRTYVRDYEGAITPQTAVLLRVHASNFRIVGFTHAPTVEEMVALGQKSGLPVLHDLGSGCLLDTTLYGLVHEPTPQESITAGVGLALFSGDKLMGGPQTGIIVGQQTLVETLSRHPLARALRLDKLSLAALSATLLHYVRGEAPEKVPVWQMVAAGEEGLKDRAQRWADQLGSRAAVVNGESTVGGGSLPGETLATWLLALDSAGLSGGATEVARRLREHQPPVIARVQEERVILDPRTVFPEEEDVLIGAVKEVLG